MKDLHDAILNLRPVPTINGPRDAYAWAGGYETARRDAAVLVAEYRQKLGRPWRATERQVENHGDNAEFLAWRDWCEERRLSRATQQDYFLLCCAVADAICPPPSPLANVLYDLIDDCFEKGRTPTPEEIEPFLRPKVKPLVWEHIGTHRWIAPVPHEQYEVYHNERDDTFSWYGAHIPNTVTGRCDTLELAQAAAQSHWDARAEEFYREAFE